MGINHVCRASETDIPLEPATEAGCLGDAIERWQQAALRVGEELADVGPDAYYHLTPHAWVVWALAAARLLKERLAARERELAELKAFHYRDSERMK